MPKPEGDEDETPSIGLRTVVIDAGHGGHDPGNLGTGRFKKTEKDVALAVSLKLGKTISETYPKVKVIYTRDDDTFIGLRERTEIANKANADLFISIHCNAFTRKEARGTETYVMGLHKSKANLEVAKKENASILLEENYEEKYSDFDPNSDEQIIARTLMQSAFRGHSFNFSRKVQDLFESQVKRQNRGVKEAGFVVISYTTMPSVLIELGFLTNQEEEDFLMSEEGQDFMAAAIFDAFRGYKTEQDAINANIIGNQEPEKAPEKEEPVTPEPESEQPEPENEKKGRNKDKKKEKLRKQEEEAKAETASEPAVEPEQPKEDPKPDKTADPVEVVETKPGKEETLAPEPEKKPEEKASDKQPESPPVAEPEPPKVEPKSEEPKPKETKPEPKPVVEEPKETKPEIVPEKTEPVLTENLQPGLPIYKIQLLLSERKVALVPERFNGLEKDLWYYKDGKYFKYTYGKTTSFREAVNLQRKARESGYAEAFIVAFHEGKRIPTAEAIKITKSRTKTP